MNIELTDAILTALERGVKSPDELAATLWPTREDSERAVLDASRCLEWLVATGNVEAARFADGDIFIPRVDSLQPRWLGEHSTPVFGAARLERIDVPTRQPLRSFDTQAIAAELKSRFGCLDAAVELPAGPNGTTTLHYVGGMSDRNNAWVGELEGVESAVERLMAEFAWPSTTVMHEWHDPHYPLRHPFGAF